MSPVVEQSAAFDPAAFLADLDAAGCAVVLVRPVLAVGRDLDLQATLSGHRRATRRSWRGGGMPWRHAPTIPSERWITCSRTARRRGGEASIIRCWLGGALRPEAAVAGALDPACLGGAGGRPSPVPSGASGCPGAADRRPRRCGAPDARSRAPAVRCADAGIGGATTVKAAAAQIAPRDTMPAGYNETTTLLLDGIRRLR